MCGVKIIPDYFDSKKQTGQPSTLFIKIQKKINYDSFIQFQGLFILETTSNKILTRWKA